MADNVVVSAGTGTTVAADELTDATLGSVKVQFVKLMDGTLDSSTKAAVSAAGLKVDLGADNDVTLATLPDTAANDLAEINAAVTSIDDAIGTTGQVAAASSVPVVGCFFEQESVAASQTDQVLGATGATGDYLHGVLVVPETTSPGVVTLEDNGASAFNLFTGGADSVATLQPFWVPVMHVSAAGAFSITTGANVHCRAVGLFT